MKERRYGLGVLLVCALFALALTALLWQLNVKTPRLDAAQVAALTDIPEDGPVLLMGGRYYEDETGRACRALSLHCDRLAYLYFPRSSEVTLNGEGGAVKDVYRGSICSLEPNAENGGDFSVVISYAGKSMPPTNACVYFGSYEQILDFQTTSAQLNAYVQGLCFAIMLLSLLLLVFKHSERYLLWLALLCFFRGNYYRVSYLLTVVTWIPGLSFLGKGNTYLIVSELFTAVLQYKIMESFVQVRIGRLPFPWYAALAALPCVLLHTRPVPAAIAGIVFYVVLYLCYLVCFLRLPETALGERNLLLAAWVLTVTLRLFDELCELGLIPSGDVNLYIRLRGVVSIIFVIAFFAVVGKIFARKFQEADELNVDLENKIRQKTRQQTLFVRSMLHNLKTPLFSLSGYSDMALRSVDRNPEQARQYMEKAREKAIFAGELMDHIFLVTQMDADMVHLQFAPVNLGQLLRAVAETPTAGQEGKELHLELELPENVFLQADQLYLRQAFQNIVDNARINTPDGGTIRISLCQEAHQVRVTIRDTGCGIAPEEQERIFDAYYSNRHGKQQSSGLGLYITAEIVKRHGGSIRVESEPGQGSAFCIQLPCAAEEEGSEKI